MKIKLNLKNLRKSKLITQKEIAKKTGWSTGKISMLENNKITPNLPTMQKLADALEVDLQTIVACFVQDKKQQKTKKE